MKTLRKLAVVVFSIVLSHSQTNAADTVRKYPIRPRRTLSSQTDAQNNSSVPLRKSSKTNSQTSSDAKSASAQDNAVSGSARLESVRQSVEIQSGTKAWSKARGKDVLNPSDKVRTGKQSIARIKLQDGSKVLLLQNSQAELENLSSVQKTIKLIRGRVRAIVTRLKGPQSFQIKTPIGVASVRGTEFEVEFSEDDKNMQVNVMAGQVGVSKLGDLASEVLVNPGEAVKFGIEGDIGDPIRAGAAPINQQDVRSEIQIASVKDSIVSMAAEEERNADYQVGKSLIDVDGKRVRVEEYIMRPASNQFKLVALNERSNRFDYFTYKGTFNKDLPADLSTALKDVGGKLGTTAPDYYLTDYEMLMSNTKDKITDSGSGGHLVKIDFDGTNYTISENPGAVDYDATNTKTVAAATLQSDGSYKIYNPVKDAFSLVSAGNLSEAQQISVRDPSSDSYRNITSGDRLWKTRFDSSSYYINTTLKTAFAKKSTVNHALAVDLDATFSNAPITTISETPDGAGTLHNRLSLYFSDGSKTVYDNYIIDDKGNVGSASVFAGLSSGADYRNELLNWNYQQKITATEMDGDINLVIDPRIGTVSGLIQ